MKTYISFAFLLLAFTVRLNAQTYITSSDSTLCSGESATLTAHHDFLHNFCTWSNGGNGNTIVVSPTINTVYTVTCADSDANTTSAGFTQTVSLCLGIKKELANTVIEIFPNPSSDQITVSGLEKNTCIEIYNALGARTYSAMTDNETLEINLNNYQPGIYFIKLKLGAYEITRKIIKH